MKAIQLLCTFSLVTLISVLTQAQEAGNALSYDGVDEYTSFGNPALMQVDDYTITMWFYAEDNTRSLLTRGASQGAPSARTFDLYGDGADLILFFNSTGGPGHTHVVGAFELNQWNHVAITYEDSVITTLLNGINLTESKTTFAQDVASFDWDLGGNGAYTFKGRLDEFRFWSSPRGGDTFRDKMHARYLNWSGLVGSYSFNASSGSNLDDLDAPDDDGTNINMEDADWVTSYVPMGNLTSRTSREQRGIWQASGTNDALDSDGFYLQTDTPLSETEYATYGNDNWESLNIVSDADLPAGVAHRLGETWYIDVFGSVPMNPTFDLNRIMGFVMSAGAPTDYCLLYRDSTTGPFVKLNYVATIIGSNKIRFENVVLQDGYYTLASNNVNSSPLEPEYIVGQSYFGENDYIEYIPGDLPILIASPHGGTLDTDHLPIVLDRGTDGGSQLSSLMTMDSIVEYTDGCRPHVILNHIRPRHFLGTNPMIYSSGSHPEANQAWSDYHNFVETAKAKIVEDWGAGHYFDMHTTARPRNQIGMGITGTELNGPDSVLMNRADESTVKHICSAGGADFLEFLRGDECFGSALQDDGWDSTPSWDNLAPSGPFFYAGQNTWRHGSNDYGVIDATHVESSANYINTSSNRPHYSASVGKAMIQIMEVFYGFSFDCSTNSLDEQDGGNNFGVFPNPISVSEQLQIETSEPIEIVRLFSITGEEILAPRLKDGYLPQSLESGVYLLSVNFANGEEVARRIVVR